MARSSRIHPCLCGHEASTLGRMRHHRRHCEVWKNRPDPKGLARQRRQRRQLSVKGPCSLCGKRNDHHAHDCPDSQQNRTRRELLLKYGLNPKVFEAVLRVLAKRYEDDTRLAALVEAAEKKGDVK